MDPSLLYVPVKDAAIGAGLTMCGAHGVRQETTLCSSSPLLTMYMSVVPSNPLECPTTSMSTTTFGDEASGPTAAGISLPQQSTPAAVIDTSDVVEGGIDGGGVVTDNELKALEMVALFSHSFTSPFPALCRRRCCSS